MKKKIEDICNRLNREQLSVHGATNELLSLFSVSGSTLQPENDYNFTCLNCGCNELDLPLRLTPRVWSGKPKCADCGLEFDK